MARSECDFSSRKERGGWDDVGREPSFASDFLSSVFGEVGCRFRWLSFRMQIFTIRHEGLLRVVFTD